MWFISRAGLVALGLLLEPILGSAAVPTIEREALIALYDSTNGDAWRDNTNWLAAPGTECTWEGVVCNAAETTVLAIQLSQQNLTGSIPAELGNLSGILNLSLTYNDLSGGIPPDLGNLRHLMTLNFVSNQLTGSIPETLGNLSGLRYLGLHDNRLTGSIPPELGNLSDLIALYAHTNRLTGSIPPELGNLSDLLVLHLSFNRLTGSIPPELENLVGLSQLSLRFNALWTDDPDVQVFLDGLDPGWDSNQTVAPGGLAVSELGETTVWLEWTPIAYTGDVGGYGVGSEPVGSDSVTLGGWTPDKSTGTFPVTGLEPGQAYDLTVVTRTLPHAQNGNLVVSDPTAPTMVTMSDLGCTAPVVTTTGSSVTYTLTVTSMHDSYEWSTGETTSSIAVSPHRDTWFWVRATGPAGCDESAVVVIPVFFADGFESGDISAWSSTTS